MSEKKVKPKIQRQKTTFPRFTHKRKNVYGMGMDEVEFSLWVRDVERRIEALEKAR